jgi:hypothetical protein
MVKKSKRPAGALGITSDEQEVGTGLLNDVDVEVVAAEWTLWNYGNDAQPDVPFLHLTVIADEAEENTELYLSAGRPDRVVPTEDGEWLVAAEGSSAKGLSNSSNAAAFLQSLENAGYDKDSLGSEPISQLVGLYFHLLRVPQPKRSGLPAAEGERERTMPTCSEIHSLPGEDRPSKKKKAGGAASGKQMSSTSKKPNGGAGASRQRAASDEDSDEDEDEEEDDTDVEDETESEGKAQAKAQAQGGSIRKEARAVVLNLLKAPEYRKKGVPKTKLFQLAFAALKDNPAKKKILSLMQEDDFLESGPWNSEGDTITAEA